MTAPLTDAEVERLEGLAIKWSAHLWPSAKELVSLGGFDPALAAYIAALDTATFLRLLGERKELRATLEFYAQPWNDDLRTPDGRKIRRAPNDLVIDNGKRARDALGSAK